MAKVGIGLIIAGLATLVVIPLYLLNDIFFEKEN